MSRYWASWNPTAIPMQGVVSGPGAGTASLAAGVISHRSTGSSTYGLLAATAVQTALNAVVAGFTVTFNETTLKYTLSHASVFGLNFGAAGTAGTALQRALGFSATNLTGANSYVSDVTPYYVIDADTPARSQYTDLYEPEGIAKEAVSDGGSHYAVDRDTTELWCDWTQSLEIKARVFDSAATASVPWTWQAFFKHCRAKNYFTFDDGVVRTVHKLRAQGAQFGSATRSRIAEDYDAYWNIRLLTRYFATA